MVVELSQPIVIYGVVVNRVARKKAALNNLSYPMPSVIWTPFSSEIHFSNRPFF